MLVRLNLLLFLYVYVCIDVLSLRTSLYTTIVLFPIQQIGLYYTYYYFLLVACLKTNVEACCTAHARPY
jgi:hypothetical protein